MARLCIRIAPNNHPTDPSLDKFRTQVGDVVCVVEDGHVWSKAELNCGHYRFLDVPGVPEKDLAYLASSVLDPDDVLLKFRAVTLNATALTSDLLKSSSTATKTQIDAITLAKA